MNAFNLVGPKFAINASEKTYLQATYFEKETWFANPNGGLRLPLSPLPTMSAVHPQNTQAAAGRPTVKKTIGIAFVKMAPGLSAFVRIPAGTAGAFTIDRQQGYRALRRRMHKAYHGTGEAVLTASIDGALRRLSMYTRCLKPKSLDSIRDLYIGSHAIHLPVEEAELAQVSAIENILDYRILDYRFQDRSLLGQIIQAAAGRPELTKVIGTSFVKMAFGLSAFMRLPQGTAEALTTDRQRGYRDLRRRTSRVYQGTGKAVLTQSIDEALRHLSSRTMLLISKNLTRMGDKYVGSNVLFEQVDNVEWTWVSGVETILGYRFKDRSLLKATLRPMRESHTHGVTTNDSLEYPGDSVVKVTQARAQYEAAIQGHPIDRYWE
ncbi:MAG: hypothetical protein J3Q66DRAFT_422080 [Benniella sp.]|nr:MAG: hypothetical protein J3Q66DRAFT_422080 [Benniella sp.]